LELNDETEDNIEERGDISDESNVQQNEDQEVSIIEA
jgi:hypothetical protein